MNPGGAGGWGGRSELRRITEVVNSQKHRTATPSLESRGISRLFPFHRRSCCFPRFPWQRSVWMDTDTNDGGNELSSQPEVRLQPSFLAVIAFCDEYYLFFLCITLALKLIEANGG